MRISDWSSDVCSSDLVVGSPAPLASKPGVLRFPVGSKPFPVGADPMGPPDLVDEVRHRYPRAWAALESGRRSRRIWLVAAAEPRARNGEPSPTLWLRTAALAMTTEDRKSTRLNSSHYGASRLP